MNREAGASEPSNASPVEDTQPATTDSQASDKSGIVPAPDDVVEDTDKPLP